MTVPYRRVHSLRRAALHGAVSGMLGVAVMTSAERLEQAFTHRPNSYVPARTLLTLLGRNPSDNAKPWAWNHAMHWGTGALLGSLRGIWADIGISGAQANALHTVIRLAFDQTMENATGAGAPPDSWPRRERVVDIAHKGIYSLATGLLADRMISPALKSHRGLTSH